MRIKDDGVKSRPILIEPMECSPVMLGMSYRKSSDCMT